MTNMAIAELIKKFMDLDETYFLKDWTLHFNSKDTVTFDGVLVPKYRKAEEEVDKEDEQMEDKKGCFYCES